MVDKLIDKRLSLIISLQVFLFGAKNCLIEGIPLLYEVNDRLNSLIIAAIGIMYIYAFVISISRHLSRKCVLFWLFILFSFIFTVLAFPENMPYIKDIAPRFIIVFFITSILIAKLKTFEYLERYMTQFAYPTILAGVIAGYFINMIGHVTTAIYDGDQYATSLSYAVLVAVMWLLHRFFKDGGVMPLTFSVIGVMIIVLYGSRNPLLALFLYLFFEIWDKSSNNKIRGVLYKFILLTVGIMFFFYKPIIRFLAGLSESFGFNSRTLFLLSEADVDQTGRDSIHKEVWRLINNNPIIGTGIQGDRTNLGEMAHSLFLNIWCTYGYFIGTMFMVIIALWLFKALKSAVGLDHQILVLYFCLVVPRGFTGGDMWQSDIFWWLMAIIFVIQSKQYYNVNKGFAIQN